jgi:hypothetical protein
MMAWLVAGHSFAISLVSLADGRANFTLSLADTTHLPVIKTKVGQVDLGNGNAD